jgi:hypothetical protein
MVSTRLATPLLLLALVAVGVYVHQTSSARPVALENDEDVSIFKPSLLRSYKWRNMPRKRIPNMITSLFLHANIKIFMA